VTPLSGPRTTRRTRSEIQALRDELHAIVASSAPTTARFTFYVAAAKQLVPKTTAGYRTVQRLLALMREEGEMPFSWIADNTRWMRKPTTFDGIEQCLRDTAATYRRALWSRSEVYVEIWAESDSVAGVIGPVANEFDVPLMVVRGYSSKTFAYSAAKDIEADGRPARLYYFGDHDPSGLDIERSLRESLHRYAPLADIDLERVAVTAEDIEELNLPGSIKKATDTRSKGFTGMAVEIESIPTETLRTWCRNVIEQHIDQDQLDLLLVAEESERDVLYAMAGRTT
jgi:hypothetical protein